MALLPIALMRHTDSNGDPLSAGTITVYETNTTTFETIYTDAALTVSANNPYTLDAGGKIPNLYAADGNRVTIIVKDSLGAVVDTENDLWGIPETTATTALSLAGLVAADVPADGSVITVAGTGKGYTWTYDAASTATADGVVIVSPVSGVGRYVLNHNGILNFALYGETGLLGSTFDSTTSLDSAVAACGTNSIDVLYIPAGAYYFNTKPAALNARINIKGAGMFATALYKNWNSASVYDGIININDDGDGCIIEDMAFIAIAGSASGTSGTGCNVSVRSLAAGGNISFVEIRNCRFTTDGDASNNRVKYHIYFDGTLASTAPIGLRSCQILDCQVFGAETGGLYLYGTVSNKVRLTAANDAGGTTSKIFVGGDVTVSADYLSIESGILGGGIEVDDCNTLTVKAANCASIVTTADSGLTAFDVAQLSAYPTVGNPTTFTLNTGSNNIIAPQEYTIATGAITIVEWKPHAVIIVDTEADAATDDLDTITGGYTGQLLTIYTADNGRDVTLTEVGNMNLTGTTTVLDNISDTATLRKQASGSWAEVSSTDVGT